MSRTAWKGGPVGNRWGFATKKVLWKNCHKKVQKYGKVNLQKKKVQEKRRQHGKAGKKHNLCTLQIFFVLYKYFCTSQIFSVLLYFLPALHRHDGVILLLLHLCFAVAVLLSSAALFPRHGWRDRVIAHTFFLPNSQQPTTTSSKVNT